MDAERKAELRKLIARAEEIGVRVKPGFLAEALEALDALDAAEARAEMAESGWDNANAEWERVGVCDTCDNLSEDLLDAEGHEQCSACVKLAAMTAERDALRDEDPRETIVRLLRQGVDVARIAIEEWPHCDEGKAIAERDALRDALQEVEWDGWVDIDEIGCAACSSTGRHQPDCTVGRALNRPECEGGGDGAPGGPPDTMSPKV